MITEICSIRLDDNIVFNIKNISKIREDDEYAGYRAALTAEFQPMVVPMKLDITTGDKITPREIEYSYRLMLEERSIQVKRIFVGYGTKAWIRINTWTIS